jgi:hypothetical protein
MGFAARIEQQQHVSELVERNRIDCGRIPEAEVTTTLCLHHTAVARYELAQSHTSLKKYLQASALWERSHNSVQHTADTQHEP